MKDGQTKTLIARSLTICFITLTSATVSASADATTECDKLIQTAMEYAENEKAIACFKTALTLSDQIKPLQKATEKRLYISELMSDRYGLLSRFTEKEKIDRQLITICENDKNQYWNKLSNLYNALANDLKLEGKDEEAQIYSKKSAAFDKDYLTATARKNDDEQFKKLLSDYSQSVKDKGENTDQSFAFQRKLAQYYIAHDLLDKAQPMLLKMVAFAKNPRNYFDAGAEWDQRRLLCQPTEGSEKITINGKEETAFLIDNRRPSGKFNRGDLVRFLFVLSSVDQKLGQSKPATGELNEAKQNYLRHQFENPQLMLTSFEAFIEKYSHGSVANTNSLNALLGMDYE